jgi:hypothetical protein
MADGLILEFEGFGEGDLVEGQEGYFPKTISRSRRSTQKLWRRA